MDTHELDRLIDLVVTHVADYRENEIARVDNQHVLKWLQQFDSQDQPIILQEIERLLGKSYISRKSAKIFIESLSTNEALAGADPKIFWKKVGFLRLQKKSQSQGDMLALLAEVLTEKFGLSTAQESSTDNIYVYLDDVCCSGNQIKNDLLNWIDEKNIQNSTIHIVTIAAHRYGEYYAKREIRKVCAPRKINLQFWASVRRENSPNRIQDSEVMWPTNLPNDPYVKKWESTFPKGEKYFIPRPPGGKGSVGIFTSEQSRELVEQAFVKKGAYIFSLSQNPSKNMRPLGFSALRSPGFGATIVTYRNCPNNAPLVLWWGDPNGGSPLNQWLPLLQRRPRATEPGANFDDIDL